MSNKIGRFEIINEIARSEIGCTYKASDSESGYTVALKTINLELLGDQAEALVQRIDEEAETSKALSSHNIALLYGAGDIDGKLCAAMEYVQGNSIATMLARKKVSPSGICSTSGGSCAAASIMPSRIILFTTAWSPRRLCAGGTAR